MTAALPVSDAAWTRRCSAASEAAPQLGWRSRALGLACGLALGLACGLTRGRCKPCGGSSLGRPACARARRDPVGLAATPRSSACAPASSASRRAGGCRVSDCFREAVGDSRRRRRRRVGAWVSLAVLTEAGVRIRHSTGLEPRGVAPPPVPPAPATSRLRLAAATSVAFDGVVCDAGAAPLLVATVRCASRW